MRRAYWWMLFALASGCADGPEYFREHHAALPHVADITYWVEPAAGLNKSKIEKAAGLLDYMGFTLTSAAYADADITVRVGGAEECANTERVAHKGACGDLYFCARYFDTVYDSPATFAHELSHAVGLEHAQVQCSAAAKSDPTYGPACGIALMNPESERSDVLDFTIADAANFLQNRYESLSVLTPSCAELKTMR